MEQKCVSIRFFDQDFVPLEVFVGLRIPPVYQINETTGQNIAAILKDVCIRNGKNLRGQVYNGASNMSGAYNEVQAIIVREQPLAFIIHTVRLTVQTWLPFASALCLAFEMFVKF